MASVTYPVCRYRTAAFILYMDHGDFHTSVIFHVGKYEDLC